MDENDLQHAAAGRAVRTDTAVKTKHAPHLDAVFWSKQPIPDLAIRKAHIRTAAVDLLGIYQPAPVVLREGGQRRVDEQAVRGVREGGEEVEGEDDGGQDEEGEGDALEGC